MAWLFPDFRILIRGAGDLASGVAYRLVKAGLPVVMTERANPLLVRRLVSFGNAIFENGSFTVEDIHAVHISDFTTVNAVIMRGDIPVWIDAANTAIQQLKPDVVIDARMQKRNIDTTIQDAPLVIGMGPGFTTSIDCHAVLETNRGHTLGRVIWHGSALPDTGTPGTVSGYSAERVLRAPQDGYVLPAPGVAIGSQLEQGDLIASVNEQPIVAPFPGVLRGLIHPSVTVWAGLKIGDLDPRGSLGNCYTISDKALAIGGGAVEAVLSAAVMRDRLTTKAGEHASV